MMQGTIDVGTGLDPFATYPGMGVGPGQHIDNSLYEKMIDNNELVDELIHTLKGEWFDDKTNKFIKGGDQIISDKAISWVVGRILTYTSKIFSLSYLDERIIRRMVFEFEADMIADLMFPEKYGIKRRDRDFIINLAVHTFEASVYKAKEGETMRRLLEQHQIKEMTVRQEREKRGFLGLGRRSKGEVTI